MKIAKNHLKKLAGLLDQNNDLDFKSFDLTKAEGLKKMNWKKYKKDQNDLLPLLKAYQRLIRIIPGGEKAAAFHLLEENIHSAIQIASFSRREFIRRCGNIFAEQSVVEAIYDNALKKRSAVVVKYMQVLQNNEPHIRATKFN